MGQLKNFLLALLVPLPSIFFYLSFLRHYSNHVSETTSSDSQFLFLWNWCCDHPLLLANAMFFLNVNLLFWLISLLQGSHWMIDVYWTIIPVMLVHYYKTHPLAKFNLVRSSVVILMTWMWSIRLSHNYFRRENWQWGTREDWRFTDMRKQYGNNWWWISFFSVYLSQQVFLIGTCLPIYVVHSMDKPWNFWDSIASAICIVGIVIAYYADTQLHNYVTRNEKLKQIGEPIVPILDEGLWRYSRHPNYFGEQLWWWGVAIFGWNLGFAWSFTGTFINSLCLAYVTVLVEQRMVKQDYRAEAYKEYQKRTSVWVPWFKSSPKEGKDKKA